MLNNQSMIKYVKHNNVRIKADKKREEITNMFLEFFDEVEKKPTGMKGFMVIDDLQNSQECIVLTFWEKKEDMDSFYNSNNNALSDLVEKLKPSFEHSPVRKDYQVVKLKVR